MNKKYNVKNNMINLLLFFCSIIIIVVNCYLYTNKEFALNNISDEFGYLSNARYLRTGDKQGIASLWTGYYSYGYSVLLIPIISLFNNINDIYASTIFLNIFCLILAYCISLICTKYLLKDSNFILRMGICLASILYTSNAIFTKWVWPETVLVLLIWISVYLFIQIDKVEYINAKYIICLGLLFLITYIMHQRTLVLIIASIITLIYMLCINKKKLHRKDIVVIVLGCIFLLFLFYVSKVIKSNILHNVYENNVFTNINNMSGIANNVLSSISLKGFNTFILGLFGKVWYFIVSTFLVGIISISRCIKKLIVEIKSDDKKVNDSYVGTHIYVLMSFIGTLLLNTIFMMGTYERHDTLIYGRYMEYLYGPILVLGFIEIYENRKKINKFRYIVLFTIIILIVSSLVTAFVWGNLTKNYYKSMFSSAIVAYFFPLPKLLKNVPLLICLTIICIVVLFYFILRKFKNKGIYIVLIVSAVIWMFHSIKYNESAYVYNQTVYNKFEYMKQTILSINDFNNIYILYNENDSEINANKQREITRLQTIMFEEQIVPIKFQDIEKPSYSFDGIYIVSQSAYELNKVKSKFKDCYKLFENKEWIIYYN